MIGKTFTKKFKKPLITAVHYVLNKLDHLDPSEAREVLYEAFNKTKIRSFNQLPPLYLIGGTALGGLMSLK